jgi:hypothetical protein
LTIKLRCPGWLQKSMVARVAGKSYKGMAGEYLAINRAWKTGDTIEVTVPMALRTEPMPDNPKRVAILYGPVVLTGIWDKNASSTVVPVLVVGDKPVTTWLSRVRGNELRFKSNGSVKPTNMTFMPFPEVQHEKYSVYFDMFSKDQWAAKEAEYRAEEKRLKELEARTVDLFAIGEMQPERDHNLAGEKTSAGDIFGRKYRHADDGGWFSFDLKVDSEKANVLVMTYWGSDRPPRTFELFVDGVKVATQALNNNAPERFFDAEYTIPLELTKAKKKVNVKVQALPGNTAGGVFGVRMLRK